jgi:hypothetical protein
MFSSKVLFVKENKIGHVLYDKNIYSFYFYNYFVQWISMWNQTSLLVNYVDFDPAHM